jgi:SAM-dependent methyltransferase
MYKSKEYWNTRKKPNKYNHIMQYEALEVLPFVKDVKSVLDFGCGIGRTMPLYIDKDVTGLDFSSIYKDRIDKKVNHIIHDVHDSDLPFTEDHFDCGVLIKVLLHANTKEAERIISEVGRVCKKVLIISYNGTSKGLAPHVFKHDYKKLIEGLGFTIVSYYDIEDNQVVIQYVK